MSEQTPKSDEITRNEDGDIPDSDGRRIKDLLWMPRENYRLATKNAKAQEALVHDVYQQYRGAKEVVDSMGSESPQAATDKLREMHETSLDARGELNDVEDRVKARLWDAHDYYTKNKDAVQQHAIEDANEAGHDIDYGGQHYPAQTPEQPKQ